MGVQEGRNEEGMPDGSPVNGILVSEGNECGASGARELCLQQGSAVGAGGRGGLSVHLPGRLAGSWGPRLPKLCRVLRAGGCALSVGRCHPQFQVGGETPASAGFCFKTSFGCSLWPLLPVPAASRALACPGLPHVQVCGLWCGKHVGWGRGRGRWRQARRDRGAGPPGAPAASSPPRVPGCAGDLPSPLGRWAVGAAGRAPGWGCLPGTRAGRARWTAAPASSTCPT